MCWSTGGVRFRVKVGVRVRVRVRVRLSVRVTARVGMRVRLRIKVRLSVRVRVQGHSYLTLAYLVGLRALDLAAGTFNLGLLLPRLPSNFFLGRLNLAPSSLDPLLPSSRS